jgi:hypothetical protein
MRLHERIAGFLDRLTRGRRRVDVVADDAGVKFILDGQTVSPAFSWGEVTEVRVFKRDLGIVDDVRLAFIARGGWYEFSEEQEGFERLGEKMRDVLPEIPADWFTTVVQPPFATNERTLFRRPEPGWPGAVTGEGSPGG